MTSDGAVVITMPQVSCAGFLEKNLAIKIFRLVGLNSLFLGLPQNMV